MTGAKLLFSGLVLSQLLSLSSVVASTTTTTTPRWDIQHSWDGGATFVHRGTVSWDAEKQELVVSNDEECMSPTNLQTALDVGWYQLQLVPSNGDSASLLTTVPACDIQRAQFKDEFQFLLNRQDQMISFGYVPLISPLAPTDCSVSVESAIAFQSKSFTEVDVPAMTLKTVLPNTKPPPGMMFLKRDKGDPMGGGGGGPQANEPIQVTGPASFIRRYWYILLPLFLANFLPSESPQAPEGQEQAQQQQQGSSSGTASAPAGGGESPSKKGRRGKRG